MVEDKKHNIDSLKKLCNTANKDNIEILAIDVANWLISYVNAIEIIRKQMPEQTKDLTNYEIAKGSFVWIDDGKNDFKGMTIKTKK